MVKLNSGIEIIPINGHFIIQRDGILMTCDIGELSTAIPEFMKYYKEQINKRDLLHMV